MLYFIRIIRLKEDGRTLNTIAYADNLLASEGLRSLQIVLQGVEDGAEKLGLPITAKKSRLICSSSMPKENISRRIKDQLVPKVGVMNQLEFKETVRRYLGVDFN